MDILQTVLSSVVVVALINMFVRNKSDRLQYVMKERERWRNDLKKCIEELGRADKGDINNVLASLKANLNAYGYHDSDDYPPDVKLNFFKDEHIWKEIDIIEQEYKRTSNINEEVLDIHKKNLIAFLNQLLTFDLNKSTAEISDNKISNVSIILFLISIVTCLYLISAQQIAENYIQIFIILITPYILVWLPYWIESPSILKPVKWYKKFNAYLFSWSFGMVFAFIEFWAFQMTYRHNLLFPFIPMTLLIMSMVCAFIYVMSKKNLYKLYDDEIMRLLNINQILIVDFKPIFVFLKITDFFLEEGINSRVGINDRRLLEDSTFISYFKGLSYKEKINSLKWSAKIQYKFKKKDDIYSFIKKKPARCKCIVRYEVKKGVYEYSIGYQKSKWKIWIENMDKIKK